MRQAEEIENQIGESVAKVQLAWLVGISNFWVVARLSATAVVEKGAGGFMIEEWT